MIRKRIQFAQNFLTSHTLVEKLVSRSSIKDSDIVYEIGPGDGIITSELEKKAAKVIAIEIDQDLANSLKNTFLLKNKVEICIANFLDYEIKYHKYKVFSNIPFNITSDIVKKLISLKYPPLDAYLIMQKEAAMKFSGDPHETEFSVLAKPWFSFSVEWTFRRTDFFPIPSVDVVLLHISTNQQPLISDENADIYRKFVKHGFRAWKKDLKTAYKDVFTYEQWKRLAKDNTFPLKATPTQLNFEQWLNLFNFFVAKVLPFGKNIP